MRGSNSCRVTGLRRTTATCPRRSTITVAGIVLGETSAKPRSDPPRRIEQARVCLPAVDEGARPVAAVTDVHAEEWDPQLAGGLESRVESAGSGRQGAHQEAQKLTTTTVSSTVAGSNAVPSSSSPVSCSAASRSPGGWTAVAPGRTRPLSGVCTGSVVGPPPPGGSPPQPVINRAATTDVTTASSRHAPRFITVPIGPWPDGVALAVDDEPWQRGRSGVSRGWPRRRVRLVVAVGRRERAEQTCEQGHCSGQDDGLARGRGAR